MYCSLARRAGQNAKLLVKAQAVHQARAAVKKMGIFVGELLAITTN